MEVSQKFPSKSPLTSPNLRHHGKKMLASPKFKIDLRKGISAKLYDNHGKYFPFYFEIQVHEK